MSWKVIVSIMIVWYDTLSINKMDDRARLKLYDLC